MGGGGTEAAFLLPAGELGLERVEALLPERAEGAHPLVELPERLGVDGVEPPRAFRSDGREAAVPQYPEVSDEASGQERLSGLVVMSILAR